MDTGAVLSSIEGAKGAAIFRKDGSIVASRLPQGVDAKELSKRAAGLAEAFRAYSERAGGAKANYACASGPEGVVAMAENAGLLLVFILPKDADLDSAAVKTKKAAEKLQELA